MPTYKITDPTTGKTVKLTGDTPPTQEDLDQVFSQIHGQEPTQQSFAQRVQSALSEGAGKVAMGAMKSDLLPTAIKAPVFLGAMGAKAAVEHPKEAAILAGTVGGAALSGGFSLPVEAGLAGIGAAGGAGYGQLIERGLGKETPQTSLEAAKDIGKTGGTAALATLALGGAGKLAGKAIGKVVKVVKTARTKPNLEQALENASQAKLALKTAKQAAKEGLTNAKQVAQTAYKKTIEEAKNVVNVSNKLIGDVEELTGLSKIKIPEIPTIQGAPGFAEDLSIAAKNVKEMPTNELFIKGKQAQEFYKAYPQMKSSLTGKQIAEPTQIIRNELKSRIQELDDAVRINSEARKQLASIPKPPKLTKATVSDANVIKAREEVKLVRRQLKEKEEAIKKVKIALAAGLGVIGIGPRRLIGGVKKVVSFLGE